MDSTMIGPFSPLIVCWTSLLVTVVGLVVGFFYTNITAFARSLRDGSKKPAAGAEGLVGGKGGKG